MIIVGISGSICSGKKTLSNLLESTGNFEVLQLEAPSFEMNIDMPDPHPLIKSKLSSQLKKSLVIYPISAISDLALLQSDSRFVFISLDTPVRLRYQRYVKLYGKTGDSLRNFLEKDDFLLYNCSVYQMVLSADRILQNSGSIEELAEQINSMSLLDKSSQRPSFDLYFIRFAELVSTRSGCLRHRGGCVLTHSNRIISTGYSGIPRTSIQCIDGGCSICYKGETGECFCSHAEMNAILEGKSKRILGCTLYMKIFPCLACAEAIIQIRAEKVYYSQQESLDEKVSKYLESGGVSVNFLSLIG